MATNSKDKKLMKKNVLAFITVVCCILSPQVNAAPMGTAFTYQGRLNDGGAPAVATTNGQYVVTDVFYPEGRLYRLHMVQPPVILQQPQSQKVYQNQPVTFSVRAAGSAPLSYQWYDGNNAAIAGATSSDFSISSVQPSHAGSYFAIVTNADGSALSAFASLSVVPSN